MPFANEIKSECPAPLSRRVSSRQPLNQRWHRIVRQMIQELADRVNPLSTGRAPRYNNAAPALGN